MVRGRAPADSCQAAAHSCALLPAPPRRRSGAGIRRTQPRRRLGRGTGCRARRRARIAAAAIPARGPRPRARPRSHGRLVPALRPALHDQTAATAGAAARARTSAANCAAWSTAGRLAIHVDPIEKKPFFHFLPGSSAYSLGHGRAARCAASSARTGRSPRQRPATTTAAVPEPGCRCRCRRPPRVAGRRVHLQRADGVRRVRPRHRRGGPQAGAAAGHGQLRLHERAAARRPVRGARRHQDRSRRDSARTSTAPCRAPRWRPCCAASRRCARPARTSKSSTSSCRRSTTPTRRCAGLVDWVMGELGPDVPLHFTRFHPDYQLLQPAADARRHARARPGDGAWTAGLRYVYVGNVPGHPGNHTYCPGCRARVITRQDFFVLESTLKNGRCGACGARHRRRLGVRRPGLARPEAAAMRRDRCRVLAAVFVAGLRRSAAVAPGQAAPRGPAAGGRGAVLSRRRRQAARRDRGVHAGCAAGPRRRTRWRSSCRTPATSSPGQIAADALPAGRRRCRSTRSSSSAPTTRAARSAACRSTTARATARRSAWPRSTGTAGRGAGEGRRRACSTPAARRASTPSRCRCRLCRYVFPGAAIVPVVVGSPDPEQCRRFGRALAALAKDRRVLIVASSDLSHYPAQRDAARRRPRARSTSIAAPEADAFDDAEAGAASLAGRGVATCACGDGADPRGDGGRPRARRAARHGRQLRELGRYGRRRSRPRRRLRRRGVRRGEAGADLRCPPAGGARDAAGALDAADKQRARCASRARPSRATSAPTRCRCRAAGRHGCCARRACSSRSRSTASCGAASAGSSPKAR